MFAFLSVLARAMGRGGHPGAVAAHMGGLETAAYILLFHDAAVLEDLGCRFRPRVQRPPHPEPRNPARDAGQSKNNSGATVGKHLLSQPSTRTQTPRAERRPPACRE